MLRYLSLLILPMLIGPVLAEEQPPAVTPPAVDTPAVTPPANMSPSPHHPRQTWEQHFAQANQAHDGHLTQAEAKAGFPLVAKHFDDIDVDHKGYVTEDDVRAWQIMRKAARRLVKPPADKLKPQHAFQLRYPGLQPVPLARTAAQTTRNQL